MREEIAKRYRFIAYTQRYFGTEPWPDEGKNFSVTTLADDLSKFITLLNAGPVHLVGWSYGGLVAVTVAVSDPSLVRSLILYEAGIIFVLPADSPEGKKASDDWAKVRGPFVAAAKAGDFIKAAKLLLEAVFQLPPPSSTACRGIGRLGCSTTLGLSRCCSQLHRLLPSHAT